MGIGIAMQFGMHVLVANTQAIFVRLACVPCLPLDQVFYEQVEYEHTFAWHWAASDFICCHG